MFSKNHLKYAVIAALGVSTSALADYRYESVEVRNLETDWYYDESITKSMMKTIVENRLSEKCRQSFGASLEYDSVRYEPYVNGQTKGKKSRYKYSTNQAWGKCRIRKN